MSQQPAAALRIRRVPTAELTPGEIALVRELLWAAFASKHPDEGMTEEDWEHALGGFHFIAELDGTIVAHAAVVDRVIRIGDRPLRTGYVEAVAVMPGRQRRGIGTLLMGKVNEWIRMHYELGVLGTGRQRFYERLGWQTWRGSSYVAASDGVHATPDEDGYIMVLAVSPSPPLDPSAPIVCEWRPGDVW